MQNSSILPPSLNVDGSVDDGSGGSTSILSTLTTTTTPTTTTLVSNDGHMTTETIVSPTTSSTIDVNSFILNPSRKDGNKEENEPQGIQHDLCLDDLLKESYEKLMKVQQQLSPSQILADKGFESNTIMMPTTFGGNCMTSNSNYSELISATAGMTNGGGNNFNINYQHSALETINEDSIKELLYGHVG